MIMTKTGNEAGAVWRFLNENGEQSVSKLAKQVDLEPKEIQRAVGWLLRENKVSLTLKGRVELISIL